jgi:hypothetical protein
VTVAATGKAPISAAEDIDSPFCSVCGHPWSTFEDYSGGTNRRCPNCGSVERQRVFANLYRGPLAKTHPLRGKRVLIVAAMASELITLKEIGVGEVLTADVRPDVQPVPNFVVDICKMPEVPDNSFDAAITSNVLACVYDLEGAIAELARVLKPGGFLLTCDPLLRGKHTEEYSEIGRITDWYGLEALQKYRIGNFRTLGDLDFDPLMERFFDLTIASSLDVPTGRTVYWYVGRKPRSANGKPTTRTRRVVMKTAIERKRAASPYLFAGSTIPPDEMLGATGFHSLLNALGLKPSASVLCVGGGSWIPNGSVAALVDAGYKPNVIEWRRHQFVVDLRSRFASSIELTEASPDEVRFERKFDFLVFDLFSSDSMSVIGEDILGAVEIIEPGGIVVTRFVYDLTAVGDADLKRRIEERFVARFGRPNPTIEDIDRTFAGTPFQVLGLVDRFNGSGATRSEGWLVLRVRTDRHSPPKIKAPAQEVLPAPARKLEAPITLKASRPTERQRKTYSTPLDPATGFRRAVVTLSVPSVPQIAADSRFAFHRPHAAAGSAGGVFATQRGGVAVSSDAGEHWDYVATPDTGSVNLWHLFPLNSGNVLLQGSSPHALEDPRGTPDVQAPVFLCDRNLRLLHRSQPGKSNWHGTRSIDEANGTIIYAEYPANAVKYRRDFQEKRSELIRYCDDAAVFRSTDGGKSWTNVLEFTWEEIRHFHTALADPFQPGTWYVSSGDQPHECRIWRSTDDGVSWHEVTASGQNIDLHPSLAGQHQAINRHTDMIITEDHVIWGSDDMLGPSAAFFDQNVTMSNRVGSRLFISPKTRPLQPTLLGYVGSHVRSIIDVGAGYIVLTEAKRVGVVSRPQVLFVPKKEPRLLSELFTIDRYQPSGTGFTFSRNSRQAENGRFFTYRDRNDAFSGGPKILQWDVAFE